MAYGETMKKLSPCPSALVIGTLLDAAGAPGRLLDAGCGRGERLADLRRALPETALSGIDCDEINAAAARQCCPGAEIATGDVCALPWGDGTFDAALCECTLSLIDAPEVCLAELFRVLRPAGTLLLSDLCTAAPAPERELLSPDGAVRYLASRRWPEAAAENAGFRASVRAAAERGMPVYAECGGLIYLGRSITLDSREYPLAGVFPVAFGLSARPPAHGYSVLRVEGENAFYEPGTEIRGHEFRYSAVERWDGRPEDLAMRVERGTGFLAGRDGLTYKKTLALYTHVLAGGMPAWARGFLRAANNFAEES